MKTRKTPMRVCAGCQEQKSKKEMIRVVRTPEGAVEIDKTGKKSGRGVYLCPNSECLKRARKSRALERALVDARLAGARRGEQADALVALARAEGRRRTEAKGAQAHRAQARRAP